MLTRIFQSLSFVFLLGIMFAPQTTTEVEAGNCKITCSGSSEYCTVSDGDSTVWSTLC